MTDFTTLDDLERFYTASERSISSVSSSSSQDESFRQHQISLLEEQLKTMEQIKQEMKEVEKEMKEVEKERAKNRKANILREVLEEISKEVSTPDRSSSIHVPFMNTSRFQHLPKKPPSRQEVIRITRMVTDDYINNAENAE